MSNRRYDFLFMPSSMHFLPNSFIDVPLSGITKKLDETSGRIESYDLLGAKIYNFYDFVREQRLRLKKYAKERAGAGVYIIGDAFNRMTYGPTTISTPWGDKGVNQHTNYPQASVNITRYRDKRPISVTRSSSGLTAVRIIRASEDFEDNVEGLQVVTGTASAAKYQGERISYAGVAKDFITYQFLQTKVTAKFLMGKVVESIASPIVGDTSYYTIIRKNTYFNIRDFSKIDLSNTRVSNLGSTTKEILDLKIYDDSVLVKTPGIFTAGELLYLTKEVTVLNAPNGTWIYRTYEDGSPYLDDGSADSLKTAQVSGAAPDAKTDGVLYTGVFGAPAATANGTVNLLVNPSLSYSLDRVCETNNLEGKLIKNQALSDYRGYWACVAEIDIEKIEAFPEDFPKYLWSDLEKINWFDKIWITQLRNDFTYRHFIFGGEIRIIDKVSAIGENIISPDYEIATIRRYDDKDSVIKNLFFQSENGALITPSINYIRDERTGVHIKKFYIDSTAEYLVAPALMCSQAKKNTATADVAVTFPDGYEIKIPDFSSSLTRVDLWGGTSTVRDDANPYPSGEPLKIGEYFSASDLWNKLKTTGEAKITREALLGYTVSGGFPIPQIPAITSINFDSTTNKQTFYFHGFDGSLLNTQTPLPKSWLLRVTGSRPTATGTYSWYTTTRINVPYSSLFDVALDSYAPSGLPAKTGYESVGFGWIGPEWEGTQEFKKVESKDVNLGGGNWAWYRNYFATVTGNRLRSPQMFMPDSYGGATSYADIRPESLGRPTYLTRVLKYIGESRPTLKAEIKNRDLTSNEVPFRNSLGDSYTKKLIADVFFYGDSTRYLGEAVELLSARSEKFENAITKDGSGKITYSSFVDEPFWDRVVFETDRIAIPRLVLGMPWSILGITQSEYSLSDSNDGKLWKNIFTRVEIGGWRGSRIGAQFWRAPNFTTTTSTLKDTSTGIEIKQESFIDSTEGTEYLVDKFIEVTRPTYSYYDYLNSRNITVKGLRGLRQKIRVFSGTDYISNFKKEPANLSEAYKNSDGDYVINIDYKKDQTFYIYVLDELLNTLIVSKPLKAI